MLEEERGQHIASILVKEGDTVYVCERGEEVGHV
jgi:hypothetical protein